MSESVFVDASAWGAITNRTDRFHEEAWLPDISAGGEFVAIGGLMSYGPDPIEPSQRAAVLVDKILKGAKPADLPVEQPTKCEVMINLKTAKTLGLTIPPVVIM